VHSFRGRGDGEYPFPGLIQDATGKFYGTTQHGGSFDYGTVFEVDAHGKEISLHSFSGGDGAWPYGGLIRDKAGNLYGTTSNGGSPKGGGCRHGCGAIFKLSPAGKKTVLYAFTGGTDGGYPGASLVQDTAGNLYGTTFEGGNPACNPFGVGCGVLYWLDHRGKESVLHTFTGPDGEAPGGLIRDKMGNLYGTAGGGGAYGSGLVFRFDSAGKETVLYDFTGKTDGGGPIGSLLRDENGTFYSTTFNGGDPSCDCGVVFKLDKTGTETVLYTFRGKADGHYPSGHLVRDSAGNIYGATQEGGATECFGGLGCGTVFKVDAKGNETVLYTFTGGNDGDNPLGGVLMDRSGNLYGTTNQGGDSSCGYQGAGCGVVFKLVP
jgi:uncharacterized repeat protein (TIGR03803 family)